MSNWQSTGCFRYHKGTDFQANHNDNHGRVYGSSVVLDTTKVQIFKQITTIFIKALKSSVLFQIPQRYRFSSKSQLTLFKSKRLLLLFQIPQRYRFSSKSQPPNCCHACLVRCFRYHKGTDFQANHNSISTDTLKKAVVLDTTKVQIFKQITTLKRANNRVSKLFQIPQRYRFSSKSQPYP